jgi:hypothetical protein
MLNLILLYCHGQSESGLSTLSSIATIIISILSLIGTGIAIYISYRIPRKVALMQLKSEALKELREELNNNFVQWRNTLSNVNDMALCSVTLNNFAENYNYLFNLEEIASFRNLVGTLDNAVQTVANDPYNVIVIALNFNHADNVRQVLLADLGKRTIE